MRIKLDARVLVRERLSRLRVDQQALRLFTYHALTHRLAAREYSGRDSSQRIVERVRRAWILRKSNVARGCIQALHISPTRSDGREVILRARKYPNGTIRNIGVGFERGNAVGI
jgi:hypothetical protein